MTTKMTSEAALDELRAGNVRFASGDIRHPNTDKETLRSCSRGQNPFACILACSDSRVPVDLIFDRGVGDLFVVQVAGNVLGDDQMGSVEYAVEHLGTPLLVIVGHNNCGMVKAVYDHGELSGRLAAISKKIVPAVETAKKAPMTGQEGEHSALSPVDRAARINVWNAVEDALCNSSVIRSRVQAGACQVVGAFYWIDTGEIEWLGRHPREDEMLAAR
ncbi:MAG: carbonic anhydrase [Desulfomonilaceae bacterium]